jgi:hypothetical protein
VSRQTTPHADEASEPAGDPSTTLTVSVRHGLILLRTKLKTSLDEAIPKVRETSRADTIRMR